MLERISNNISCYVWKTEQTLNRKKKMPQFSTSENIVNDNFIKLHWALQTFLDIYLQQWKSIKMQ